MATVNKHGLSRDIPLPVRREVRQRCGFGCVVCGSGIIDYDHFDPEYAEAKDHKAEGITLLCPTCHGKVTRGMMSRQTLIEHNADPKCNQSGFSSEFFDFGVSSPELKFAGATIIDCPIPFTLGGQAPFKVEPPEKEGAPFRLSGCFFNQDGNPGLVIIQNEWRALTNNWDVEVAGPNLTIRNAPSSIALKLKAVPPKGIVVEKMDMLFNGHQIKGSEDELIVTFPNGIDFTMTNLIVGNCPIGIAM